MWHLDMDARIAGEGEDRFEEPGVADEIPAPRRDRLPRDRHNGGGSGLSSQTMTVILTLG